jgi:hypothetical protein
VYGEVHDRFEKVVIECKDGTQIDALLVICKEALGFNMYVGVAPEEPIKVVATTESGERAVWDLRPPGTGT